MSFYTHAMQGGRPPAPPPPSRSMPCGGRPPAPPFSRGVNPRTPLPPPCLHPAGSPPYPRRRPVRHGHARAIAWEAAKPDQLPLPRSQLMDLFFGGGIFACLGIVKVPQKFAMRRAKKKSSVTRQVTQRGYKKGQKRASAGECQSAPMEQRGQEKTVQAQG
jgi:hypothetical protein